jgi:hypothetical protein
LCRCDGSADEWGSRGTETCIVREFPANWKEQGKQAGPIRNRGMYQKFDPDGVVAFPGNRGTSDMVDVGLCGGSWIVKVDW